MTAPAPVRTPLVRYMGQTGSRDVMLKDETRQISGAFKYRSNYEKLRCVGAAVGVCTASTGNHGFGLSIAARGHGIPATVFVPATTPRAKIDNLVSAGANLREIDGSYEECRLAAIAFAGRSGAVYVSSFDDPDIIAAHQIMLDEIDADSRRTFDSVFVPVGGGGLLAAALLHWGTRIRVIGVEHVDGAAMSESLACGERLAITCGGFPEGLMVQQVGVLPFEICSRFMPEIVRVDTPSIYAAMERLWHCNGIRAEGAGAAALAAALQDRSSTALTACIVSGGNVDDDVFARALQTCRPVAQVGA